MLVEHVAIFLFFIILC